MFSERYNPWMAAVKAAAGTIRERREPLADNHPAIIAESQVLAQIGGVLGELRQARDRSIAQVFKAIYAPFSEIPSKDKETKRCNGSSKTG